MMCWIVTGEITVLKGAFHLSSSHLCFPYRPARKLFGSNSVSVLSSQNTVQAPKSMNLCSLRLLRRDKIEGS